uniref:Elongation of very long chain fatty acids protein 5 n=1 Tax=Lygus hesperus TaxID=30085 RepID=A0A0A9VW54_LYGHE
MVSTQCVGQLLKNMLFTATIWYLKDGFCCACEMYTTGVTAWLLLAACIFWLSPRNFMPEVLDVCDGIRPLFNALAVVFFTYIMLCYLWVGLLTALSMVFCYIDRTARKAGFPVLTDNILFTLKPNGGYLNLIEVLAFSLCTSAAVWWFNTCENLTEECDEDDDERD